MSYLNGKSDITVREHAQIAGELYLRVCAVAAATPWAVSPIERDEWWNEFAHNYAHPAGTCAAQRMADAEAYFGLREGCGAIYGAKTNV